MSPSASDPATPTPPPAPTTAVRPAPHLARPELAHVEEDTFESWQAAISRGFQEQPRPETLDFDRRLFTSERTFGHRVGSRWVSTCSSMARRLTVPGGAALPTAAVTVVTVHPPYRRRGLLSQMMRHQLDDAAGRGDVLAALWASEAQIYGRFGYGAASSRALLKGSTQRLAFLPEVEVSGSVDEVDREHYLAVAAGLHETMRPQRPGTFARDELVWEFAAFDKEFAREGASERRYLLHFDDAGDVDGFATYRFKADWDHTGPAGEVRIGELWAHDAAAHASLWRYLLDLDLARSFVVRNAPVDEPLALLASDHRAVRTEITDNLYVRLIDVGAALRGRRYAADVDLVLEVEDTLLPANTGRYRLQSQAGEDGSALVERVTDEPDLTIGVRELGAAYLGGTPLAQLHRVRRVTEHTPDAVAAASTAFGWTRAPWCPDSF